MSASPGRSSSPTKRPQRVSPSNAQNNGDDSILSSRQLEVFSRSVTATASHLISSGSDATGHYSNALGELNRSLRRPMIQRSVFSLARASPRELIKANFNTSEIHHRALVYIPDEHLKNVPESSSPFSLFQGFNASLPEDEIAEKARRKYRRQGSKGQKTLMEAEEEKGPPGLVKLKNQKYRLDHRLEMMGIRKTMSASEIREIDSKIANLNTMRKIVLDRLAGLEQEENDIEHEVVEVAQQLEDMQEELEDEAALSIKSPALRAIPEEDTLRDDGSEPASPSFMSESIYQKLPSPKSKRRKTPRRISMPILHEHLESGSRIREITAHNDTITALDFDAPFGTLVSAALDDTVRVWDLNTGRCMGLLEGHLSSVRCLQVEDNIVATGSMDATVRLWDLGQADYNPPDARNNYIKTPPAPTTDAEEWIAAEDEEDAGLSSELVEQSPPEPHKDAMANTPLFTLSAHVAEVTALHFHNNTLVSGSADKTLRQWDLEKGRCVQTLDVLWAAAQASTTQPSFTANATGGPPGGGEGWFRPAAGRLPAAEADFVGAVQVFDAALACGTADGMVRLWDLRSGMVHRSLVGHTGPVTSLQFDDVYLVTGSMDRSIRIWDLRTGSIHDAFAYDNPITGMMFDTRHIVCAAGEDVVKVYDKADGRHWDCGPGATSVDEQDTRSTSIERVRLKDGYLIEGRRDGIIGVWSC